MALARESGHVPLPAVSAQRLWTDTTRWPTFIDGFARVLELDPTWPQPGSKVIWESGPAGRGRVTERIREITAEAVVTDVYEDQLTGRQTVTFDPDADDETFVMIELDYTLQKGGPLRRLTDLLFIRRALTDALGRTMRRFSTEAADEATL
jgi:hypothetical protein